MSTTRPKLHGKVEKLTHRRWYAFVRLRGEIEDLGPLLEGLGRSEPFRHPVGDLPELLRQAVEDAKHIRGEWTSDPELRATRIDLGGNVDEDTKQRWIDFTQAHRVRTNALLEAIGRLLPLDGDLPPWLAEVVDAAQDIWGLRYGRSPRN